VLLIFGLALTPSPSPPPPLPPSPTHTPRPPTPLSRGLQPSTTHTLDPHSYPRSLVIPPLYPPKTHQLILPISTDTHSHPRSPLIFPSPLLPLSHPPSPIIPRIPTHTPDPHSFPGSTPSYPIHTTYLRSFSLSPLKPPITVSVGIGGGMSGDMGACVGIGIKGV
jgi:hypothetical protein